MSTALFILGLSGTVAALVWLSCALERLLFGAPIELPQPPYHTSIPRC